MKKDNLRKFTVTIQETVYDDFTVYAENLEKAQLIAERKYNNAEFVLEPGNLIEKKINVRDELAAEESGWNEF